MKVSLKAKFNLFQRFLFLLTFWTTSPQVVSAQQLPLDNGWLLSSDKRNLQLPATVPGTVYGSLRAAGLAPDIFQDVSESQVGYLDSLSWIYTLTFDAAENLYETKQAVLHFEGLDTYAHVTLNGEKLFVSDNMFCEWAYDISRIIKSKDNVLTVSFPPLADAVKEEYGVDAFPVLSQADPDVFPVSSYVRKSAMHFGWDFAPRLLERGIWKPVYIDFETPSVISEASISTVALSGKSADMQISLNVAVEEDLPDAQLLINGKNYPLPLKQGNRHYSVAFTVDAPKLWWPNGSGLPELTLFEVVLMKGNKQMASKTLQTGIRTVELIQDPDQFGTSFYFKINGATVFMKGANYVPGYIWDTTFNKLSILDAAKEAGMNMIRVWGGGVYEDEAFYDRCDRNGLLVWQDCMFANGMYPGDQKFLDKVEKEIIQNSSRISKHPCLALWCGNNEVDVAWKNWGWQQQYHLNEVDSAQIADAYDNLFNRLIPEWLGELNAHVPYIASSPLSNWGKSENFLNRNMHYWGVWHGEEAIDSFSVNVPRFMTEYGMQSYPDFATLQEVISTDPITISSSTFTVRQKSYKGNRLLSAYINETYGEPVDVKVFCYYSQLMQGDAIRKAVEAHRSKQGFCMGTLVWQLNDVWPGASWSIIGWNETRKPAFYAIKTLYKTPLLITNVRNNKVEITYCAEPSPVFQSLQLNCSLITLDGDTLNTIIQQLPVENNDEITHVIIDNLMDGLNYRSENVFVSISVSDKGKVLCETYCFLVAPKYLNLKTPDIESQIVGNKVYLRAKTLVKGLGVQADKAAGDQDINYFDLLPGKPAVVTFDQAPEDVVLIYYNQR